MAQLPTQNISVVPLFRECGWFKGPDLGRDPDCAICCSTIKSEDRVIAHHGGYNYDGKFYPGCQNRWCKDCFVQWVAINGNWQVKCPTCRANLKRLGTGFHDGLSAITEVKSEALHGDFKQFNIVDSLANLSWWARTDNTKQMNSLEKLSTLIAGKHYGKGVDYDNISVEWTPTTSSLLRQQNRINQDDLFLLWQLSRLRGVRQWLEFNTTDKAAFMPSKAPQINIVGSLEDLGERLGVKKRGFKKVLSKPAIVLQLPIPTKLLQKWISTTGKTWPQGEYSQETASAEVVDIDTVEYWCIIELPGYFLEELRSLGKSAPLITPLWAVPWPETSQERDGLSAEDLRLPGWVSESSGGNLLGWDEETDELMATRFLEEHGPVHWRSAYAKLCPQRKSQALNARLLEATNICCTHHKELVRRGILSLDQQHLFCAGQISG